MPTWSLAVVRTVHFLATAQFAGLWLTACCVAGPALAIAASPLHAEAYRRQVRRLGWASLLLMTISGAAWLVLEAMAMSGQPLSGQLLATTLAHSQFGADFALRGVVAALLAGLLATTRGSRPAQAAIVVLSLGEMASLAWVGHAAASEGLEHRLHLAADVLHLSAAAAWLGGLVPLALVLACARSVGGPPGARIAAVAARRFSVLGVGCVALIIGSGLANTWFLVGSLAGLLGTDYGRLVLVKIGLLALLIAIAATNRQVITPRLGAGVGVALPAAARLRRAAFAEAALGATVLAAVGLLGMLPPALHAQAWWPFASRIGWNPLAASLGVDAPVLEGGVVALACLLLFALAALLHRGLVALLVVGATIALAAVAVQPLLIPATPASFRQAEVPYTAGAVAQGRRLFEQRCAGCHAQERLAGHPAGTTDGDLFWRVGDGHGAGSAAPLGDLDRWGIIWFLHACAAPVHALGPEVMDALRVPAPDFDFETAQGEQGSLAAEVEEGAVLLVFFAADDAVSRARLIQLARRRGALDKQGVRILAVNADDGIAAPAEAQDLAIATGGETRDGFALMEPGLAEPRPPHVEFLVDRTGIRARWRPEDVLDWRSPKLLARQIERLRQVPPEGGAPLEHRH